MTFAAASAALAPLPLQLVGDGLLGWALTLFLVAVAAGVVGFRRVAGLSMAGAKLLAAVFLLLALVTLVGGLV